MTIGRFTAACVFGLALFAGVSSLHAQTPAVLPAGSGVMVPSATSRSASTGVESPDAWPLGESPWGAAEMDDGGRPRHVGRGHPLEGTSWLNRPVDVGGFVGGLVGDDLIQDRIRMHSDFFYGLRIGWDLDYFWGTEIGLGWSQVELSDTLQPPRPAPADVFQVDLNYLRYVWGDSQWRPFWSLGVGLATFHFIDSMGMDYNETLVAIPLGLGLKYLHRPWMAFRLDLRDNVTIAGGGLDTMQNFTFTLGAEIRLGARPRSYWPWHPSREVW